MEKEIGKLLPFDVQKSYNFQDLLLFGLDLLLGVSYLISCLQD